MNGLDLRIMKFIAHHRISVVTDVARALMRIGLSHRIAVGSMLALGVYVVLARRWRFGVSAMSAFFLGTALAWALKDMIERPRPPRYLVLAPAGSSAMPSTHALFTSAVAVASCAALTWLTPVARRIVWSVVAALVVGVGLTMVYLGAHWLSDVIVGWIIGGALGLLIAYGYRDIPNGIPPRPDYAGANASTSSRTNVWS